MTRWGPEHVGFNCSQLSDQDFRVTDLTDDEVGEQLKLLADVELDAYIDWDEGER